MTAPAATPSASPVAWIAIALSLVLVACTTRPGAEAPRRGDEIMIAGRLFHTGAPVVLWFDPGGYDAYRVERRFVAWDQAAWREGGPGPESPNRYGLRTRGLSADEIERVRGGGWDLDTLRRVVDQFVIHYDAAGTSRTCFRVLHDVRGLSVHFMLDIDGTIYQTLDAKERAWHATTSNDRSVGIEIANIGAYREDQAGVLREWYSPHMGFCGTGATASGLAALAKAHRVRVTIPQRLGDGGVRGPGAHFPIREEVVRGPINGQDYLMHDLTAAQYDSLIKLTAALCAALPGIRCDYPRDDRGELVREKLSDDALERFSGVLGHYHVQANKVDPGPAFQWDRVIDGARTRLGTR